MDSLRTRQILISTAWMYVSYTIKENILFISSQYSIEVQLEAIISPIIVSIFYLNSLEKEYPSRRYIAMIFLALQFITNFTIFILNYNDFTPEM